MKETSCDSAYSTKSAEELSEEEPKIDDCASIKSWSYLEEIYESQSTERELRNEEHLLKSTEERNEEMEKTEEEEEKCFADLPRTDLFWDLGFSAIVMVAYLRIRELRKEILKARKFQDALLKHKSSLSTNDLRSEIAKIFYERGKLALTHAIWRKEHFNVKLTQKRELKKHKRRVERNQAYFCELQDVMAKFPRPSPKNKAKRRSNLFRRLLCCFPQ